MAERSPTHVVIIPSYNPGRRLAQTVREALGAWSPVWVVSDGSTDGSERDLAGGHAGGGSLRVLVRPENGGKGAAVLTAAEEALRGGFTHGLVMDADGQHPADRIADFMRASMGAPDAMVLGRPVFGPEAPWVRLNGRKLSIALATLEVLGRAVRDPLFGFRVYPLAPLARVLRATRGARRFDFDPEVAVRLTWAGVPALNLASSCRYLSRAEGGVSHFHYLSDNARMAWMHARLLTELLLTAGRRAPGAAAPPPAMTRAAHRWLALALALSALGGAAPPDGAMPAEPGPELPAAGADTVLPRPLPGAGVPGARCWRTSREYRWFPFRAAPVVLEGRDALLKGARPEPPLHQARGAGGDRRLGRARP